VGIPGGRSSPAKSVIPRTTGYLGLDIMGCRPCGFVLATMSGGYIGEKPEMERGTENI